ncbi:MAG: hypothetical protein OQK12_18135 [Motiliproteus sp.]|nr:hypothetical protein [Motiliproteus sp.]MCW9051468.1 hypothetical protein [Motiliproteus sp.]
MAIDSAVEYTIEQAVALLAGKISLQALNNKSKPVQKYCRDMFDSKDFWAGAAVNRFYQQIVNDIWQGELRTVDSQVLVKVPDSDGKYRIKAIHQSEITDEYEISPQTRFNRAELRHWAASHREAHSFLMNRHELGVARGESWEAGKQEFLEAEGYGEPVAATATAENANDQAANQQNSLDPAIAEQIAALLQGDHQYQAEELRVAIQAWLDTTAKFNKGELNGDPSSALKVWVSENLDNANDYQISRVSSMANWNSKHPKLRLVQ